MHPADFFIAANFVSSSRGVLMLEESLREVHRSADNLAFSHYIRSGHVPPILLEIVQATSSLEVFCKYRCRHKFKPKFSPGQPRVPAGSPDGGQWTDGGGGGGGPTGGGKPEEAPAPPGQVYDWTNEPNPRRVLVPDEPGLEPVYPIEGALALSLGGEAIVTAREALRAARILQARETENSMLTEHGAKRLAQRGIADSQIQEAVRTAKLQNQVITRTGKYGTPVLIHKGSNGVTVIIETVGRNAGKIITTYHH